MKPPAINKEQTMSTPEAKLKEMGIELPEFKPFHPAVAAGVITGGNMLYVSGSTPISPEYKGRVGDALTVEQGYQAARECAIGQLAQAKAVLGDLSRIKRVVKLLGMVNSAPGFGQSPAVVHGATEFYYEVFGEKGIHARSAVGLQALPNEVAVEIETIFEIE
jgi:enamine deaminase RidA (YjgF/YER057c/UK114 family)